MLLSSSKEVHSCSLLGGKRELLHIKRTFRMRSSSSAGSPGHAKCSAVVASPPGLTQQDYTWTGTDEFSMLQDRVDAPPLPLPSIREPKRVVLVRHGQSTWNAQGRIQGSSNVSVLTKKGESQAETTQQMLKDDKFDALFHSPLARADQTAQIVWGSRSGPVTVLPSLREIDLYSFQGLLKHEGKARYGEQYRQWQQCAADFIIDQQAPVRELWYRASLAWGQVLRAEGVRASLVVAHNAVNQALLATALGLPPSHFRRLTQTNAATSVLDFAPAADGPPTLTVDRINQSPGSPFGSPKPGQGRLVLVRAGAAEGYAEGTLLGTRDDALGALGRVHSQKTGELLMDLQVAEVLSSPIARAQETARTVADLQALAGYARPPTAPLDGLNNRDWGPLEGKAAAEVRADSGAAAESLEAFWERTGRVWEQLQGSCHEAGGRTVVAVTHSAVISAILCRCLGMGAAGLSLFRTSSGSVTVLDFPDVAACGGALVAGVVRCTNYTAHLGRWAVPVTRDDVEYAVCGIDGCF